MLKTFQRGYIFQQAAPIYLRRWYSANVTKDDIPNESTASSETRQHEVEYFQDTTKPIKERGTARSQETGGNAYEPQTEEFREKAKNSNWSPSASEDIKKEVGYDITQPTNPIPEPKQGIEFETVLHSSASTNDNLNDAGETSGEHISNMRRAAAEKARE